MALKDWFKSDAERLGWKVPDVATTRAPEHGIRVSHDAQRAHQIVDSLPRGADVIRSQIDRKERARWARSDEIAAYRYKSGDVVIGKHNGYLIGIGDDKPMVTVASARSGKTSTVLKPTLYTYPGSMVVLDPKGELARDTARHRRHRLGQHVCVLDPFGSSGEPVASWNPLSELNPGADTILDDVDLLCETMIIDEHGGGGDGSHWTSSARALLRGLVLHALRLPEADRNLVTVRQLLMLTYPPLVEFQALQKSKGATDLAEAAQNALFMEMAAQGDVFGGALAGAGNSFLRKASRERSSIVSTADAQCKYLDSLPLQAALRQSDFQMRDLAERPTTLYICLPSSHMATHYRWLRVVVRLALLALEKRGAWERGRPPIIFMMEEFATLGHMPIMEQAAAYFPGFGVKLWVVLQDLNQLKNNFRNTYQSFLGNAGALQFFANNDEMTLKYISDGLGSLSFVRGQFGAISDEKAKDYLDKERLIYQSEAARAFARGTGAQLVMIEGQSPLAIERLTREDVELLAGSAIARQVP